MNLISNEPEREDVDAVNPTSPAPSEAQPPPGGEDLAASEVEKPRGENPAPATAEGEAAPEPSAAELHDRWLRAEAELQNLRRRAARDREEAWRAAEEGVLLDMIAVLDDLDRALESAREAGAPESWTEGVKLTATRVRERLTRFGVVTLDPRGQPFDPRFHEALLEIDAPEDAPPGTVVQVVHKGYARGDRALRPARVVVARAAGGGAG